MFKEIFSKKAETILIIAGIFFIALSFFQYKDGIFSILNQFNIPIIIVGSTFILIGIIWTSLPSIVPFVLVFGSSKFKKISPDHYRISLTQNGEHVVNIHYGLLDDFKEYDKDCLVILPANDQFDDDCIDDRNSALGSFVNKLLPNKTEIIKSFIKADLVKRNTNVFNIGQWVCIDLNRIEETEFKSLSPA